MKKECPGKKARGCRFDADAHGVDMEVAEWVRPGASGVKKEGVTVKFGAGREKKEGVTMKGSMENWPSMGGAWAGGVKEMKKDSRVEASSAKTSTKVWPAMVSDLIDI